MIKLGKYMDYYLDSVTNSVMNGRQLCRLYDSGAVRRKL